MGIDGGIGKYYDPFQGLNEYYLAYSYFPGQQMFTLCVIKSHHVLKVIM